jgi:hypothetical protein
MKIYSISKISMATVLFNILINNFPATASPPILGANFAVIEQNFGQPIQVIEKNDDIIYVYRPLQFKQLFPEADYSLLYFRFVAGKVKLISVDFLLNTDEDIRYNWNQNSASKLFNYLFNKKTYIWKLLSEKFGGNETVYEYEYCLGDGIATSFLRGGDSQLTESVDLYYDSRCE